MSLQDDFFDIDASLKGVQRRKLRRIWSAMCEAEREALEAEDCVRLINSARRLFADKPPLSLTRTKRRKQTHET